MYFPLLRGKQYELIALKEFAEANPSNKSLFPIIEPVRVLHDTLIRAASILSIQKIPYSIILNPVRGDYDIPSNRFEISAFLHKFDEFENKPTPAFYADGKCDIVIKLIETYNLKNVMIIFEDSFDMEKANDLCLNNAVSYIVCSGADSRSNTRYLMQTKKNIIRLDDCFNVKKPNTSYRGIIEDSYSEEFFYYKKDNFYGFSDYCVLPKEFAEGGTSPTAIAIHMTYRKREDAIWVRHFVSDENYDISSIRDKFNNVIQHLNDFYEQIPPTEAVRRLIDNRDKYPGLGTLKKVTILNHIQLITEILPTLSNNEI